MTVVAGRSTRFHRRGSMSFVELIHVDAEGPCSVTANPALRRGFRPDATHGEIAGATTGAGLAMQQRQGVEEIFGGAAGFPAHIAKSVPVRR